MKIHQARGRVDILFGIQKLPAEPLPVPYVLRTPSPFPLLRLLLPYPRVAGTVRQIPLGTRSRHRESYTRRRHRR